MSKKMKKLKKEAMKEFRKALAEIVFPMFERADRDIKIYATSKGVVIVPAEDDEDYPEMAEGIALNTVSGFLGIKNKITISEISADKDGKVWSSKSIAPHLYVKQGEQKKEPYVPVEAVADTDPEEETEEATPVTDELEDLDARFEDVDGSKEEPQEPEEEAKSFSKVIEGYLHVTDGEDVLREFIEYVRLTIVDNDNTFGIRKFIGAFPSNMQITMRKLRRPNESVFNESDMPMVERCFNMLTSLFYFHPDHKVIITTIQTYMKEHGGMYLMDKEKYPWSKVTEVKLLTDDAKDVLMKLREANKGGAIYAHLQ